MDGGMRALSLFSGIAGLVRSALVAGNCTRAHD